MFGDKLRELRTNANESQEELGNLLKVAPNTVSYWEANKSTPSLTMVPKIAEHYGVTTDYMLGFNKSDIDNIEQLKKSLREMGLLKNEDLTIDELETALKIVEMMKEKK